MSFDMALDDYISKKRGGRRNETRHNSSRRSAVWNREGIDGQWKHDLYEESLRPVTDFKTFPRGARTFKAANNVKFALKKRAAPVEEEVRLHISNLPGDLVEQDIVDMFKGFNSINNVMHFDSAGAFLGEADVYFDTNSDAVAALKHFNKCEIDGAPLTLLLVNNAGEVQEPKVTSIADRLSFVPKKSVVPHRKFPRDGPVRTVFKQNYGAPQKQFFHRKNVDNSREKPYNDTSFLDRLADDEEFQREEKIKREKQELDRQIEDYMGQRPKRTSTRIQMDTN